MILQPNIQLNTAKVFTRGLLKAIPNILLFTVVLFFSACDAGSLSGGGGGDEIRGWLTQLGTITKDNDNTEGNQCVSVAVDSSGNVYCAGNTLGDMGEANGGVYDVFVMKLDSSGNLVWLTQLGATTKDADGNNAGIEFCADVAVDSSGNVYCAGYTTGNMGETNGGGNDAFVMKLNSDGTLAWLTQLGATTTGGGNNTGNDFCRSVAVDSGNVYCAGDTSGGMGETNGGSGDAFVMKLNANNGALVWLTQLGANTKDADGNNAAAERCSGVAVDNSSNVYCAGFANGDMGETNAGNNDDPFVMKLDSSGNLLWLTQLGANTKDADGNNAGKDRCNDVAVDSSGNVYCAGYTAGNIGETNAGNNDAFVMKLDSSGNLLWLTHLGTTTTDTDGSNAGFDACERVAVDSSGNVYCAGYTTGNMGETNAGSNDAFVMKLNSDGTLAWLTQLGDTTKDNDNAGDDYCQSVAVDTSGSVYCAGYTNGSMGEANAGSYDAFVLKLTPSGAL